MSDAGAAIIPARVAEEPDYLPADADRVVPLSLTPTPVRPIL